MVRNAMSEISLDEKSKIEIIEKLKQYFEDELNQQLGGFEAEFLLDFFAKSIGAYYYNQGLADALKAFEVKLEEFNDLVYQLEQPIE
ncbi:MAG: hypothetical protein ACJA2Q_000675 [Pseudohongiellaceae bacterium]|jgi:uncharacterized protein (DUF2164 family)